MDRYTLNDLEKITGIKYDTIRMWEKRYGLLNPNRTSTNRRWYTNNDLTRLISVSQLYRRGSSISMIASLSDQELNEMVANVAAEDNEGDYANLIDSLIIGMAGLDESSVNEVLLRSVIRYGFEETFSLVIFPFLRKVGVLWHTGNVKPGSEHFISNILRRKLLVAIDSLPAASTDRGNRIMMYLPEGEFHEIALLYYNYLVRKAGNQVLYLGQATPFDAVIDTADKWNPDIILTGAKSGLIHISPEDYLKQLSKVFKKKKVLVAGVLAEYAAKNKYTNIFIINNEEDLKRLCMFN